MSGAMVLHSSTVTGQQSPRRLPFKLTKATASIEARTALHVDFLMICEFDPRVIAVAEADGSIPLPDGLHHTPDYLIETDEGRCLVDVVTSTYPPTLEHMADVQRAAATHSIPYRLETGGTLRSGLTFLAARLIHDCRRRHVPAGDRVRILHTLDEVGSLPLVEAAGLATASLDGVAAVLALVCEGLVEVEIANGIVPEAPVRRRKRTCQE